MLSISRSSILGASEMPQREPHSHAAEDHLGANEDFEVVEKVLVLHNGHAILRLVRNFVDKPELLPDIAQRAARQHGHLEPISRLFRWLWKNRLHGVSFHRVPTVRTSGVYVIGQTLRVAAHLVFLGRGVTINRKSLEKCRDLKRLAHYIGFGFGGYLERGSLQKVLALFWVGHVAPELAGRSANLCLRPSRVLLSVLFEKEHKRITVASTLHFAPRLTLTLRSGLSTRWADSSADFV